MLHGRAWSNIVTIGHDGSHPAWSNYDHVQLGNLRTIIKLVQPWTVDAKMDVTYPWYKTRNWPFPPKK